MGDYVGGRILFLPFARSPSPDAVLPGPDLRPVSGQFLGMVLGGRGQRRSALQRDANSIAATPMPAAATAMIMTTTCSLAVERPIGAIRMIKAAEG